MRYGYCTGMASRGDNTGIGMGTLLALLAAGYDYVELPLAQMMALDDAAFRSSVLGPLQASGLPCGACNNFLPATLRLTGPEADLPAAREYTRRALDRAALLGAEKVVFGSSGARNLPIGWGRQQGWEQLVAAARMAGEEATARGILIVLEPLNRIESNILNTLTETLMLMREADHPLVRCLADSFHFSVGNEDPAALAAEVAELGHIHIARTLGRVMPDSDDPGLEAFLKALVEAGYRGTISIEAGCNGDFQAETKRALRWVKGFVSGV